MPELPDITVYVEALESRVVGARLERLRIGSPFVLRSADPLPGELARQCVRAVGRLGKRIVLGFENDCIAVLHLMIAGRLHWKAADAPLSRRSGLAAFDFADATLLFTEAGTTHRASLYLVRGAAALAAHDPGGLDVFGATLDQFRASLTRELHTLKRALTDPHLFDGIGNAYSDEILHAAQLSPVMLTHKLDLGQWERLFAATRDTLRLWIDKLRNEADQSFPEKVTAFRKDMAVHGRYGEPCPKCGERVQRIRYAENETNYCANCQTGGKLLADRSLSRLLRADWPRTLEELETLRRK